MPKFSLDINGVGKGAAEERKSWAGEIPPTGTYDGILEIATLGRISERAKNPANRGKPVLKIGVKLVNTPEGKYDGFIAWARQNLIEGSEAYVNQFLHSLTNGSDAETLEIEKAFYGDELVISEDRKHVERIGRWIINSPKGTLPIKVAIKRDTSYNEETKKSSEYAEIESFLMGGGASRKMNNVTEAERVVVEETTAIALDDEDEDEGTVYQEASDSDGDAVDADEMFEEEVTTGA